MCHSKSGVFKLSAAEASFYFSVYLVDPLINENEISCNIEDTYIHKNEVSLTSHMNKNENSRTPV